MRGFLTLILVVASAHGARDARGAWPTRVLSAVEPNAPFPELHIDVSWERSARQARIAREWIQETEAHAGDGSVTTLREARDVRELDYTEVTERLLVGLRVGLYRDLEFHARAPIVLDSRSSVAFAGSSESTSTVWGSSNADNPALPYRFPITEVPSTRRRAGLWDMTFGMAWSPFVDRKDEAFPTITLRADVTAPTGATRLPEDQEALPGGSGGKVGRGETAFEFAIGLAKRMGTTTPTIDPYVEFGARLPIPTSSQEKRGYEPAPSGGFELGAEVVVYER